MTYYGLGFDLEPHAWDFDEWHLPVMGVELHLDDGTPYSAVWGSRFGHFGLEFYASPMAEHLTALKPEDGGISKRSVTENRRWASLMCDPMIDAQLVWAEGYADRQWPDGPALAPLALRLDLPSGRDRIIAAMEHPARRWWLGADEVIVAFTDEFAANIGYPESG